MPGNCRLRRQNVCSVSSRFEHLSNVRSSGFHQSGFFSALNLTISWPFLSQNGLYNRMDINGTTVWLSGHIIYCKQVCSRLWNEVKYCITHIKEYMKFQIFLFVHTWLYVNSPIAVFITIWQWLHSFLYKCNCFRLFFL